MILLIQLYCINSKIKEHELFIDTFPLTMIKEINTSIRLLNLIPNDGVVLSNYEKDSKILKKCFINRENFDLNQLIDISSQFLEKYKN